MQAVGGELNLSETVFVFPPDHPTTVALKAAAESGSEQEIKKARTLFLGLKPGYHRAALIMLAD